MNMGNMIFFKKRFILVGNVLELGFNFCWVCVRFGEMLIRIIELIFIVLRIKKNKVCFIILFEVSKLGYFYG